MAEPELGFFGAARLEVFPNNSVDEVWRLLAHGGPHFVVCGDGIEAEE